MYASIQISSSAVDAASSTTKGEVIKLVEGALLIAVAAIPVAGIASVAAPFCVWKGEVALFLNDSFESAYPVPAIAEYAAASGRSIGCRCSWLRSSRRALPTMLFGAFARDLDSAVGRRCSAGSCRAFSPR